MAEGDPLKNLIRREIIGREREFIATVISTPELIDFDQSANGAPNWAVDLDIGSEKVVKNVPIKGSGSGNRFYAQLNQTVKVRRTALGRLLVIGPGDTTIQEKVETIYSLETGLLVSASSVGFHRTFFPLEHHMGPNALKGNPGITIAAAGDTLTRDAGSWLVDGFLDTQSCRLAGTLLNDGIVTVSGDPTTLVLTVSEALTDEPIQTGVTLGVVGTSLWNDGVTFMPFSRLEDADGNPV
jgi:hypothetical protein